jgi:hypothetical protein
MFVRDSCSKQLDSDRLAADVPDLVESDQEIVFVIGSPLSFPIIEFSAGGRAGATWSASL